LEQYLRDSRVMTIYEGTTGMQALDFLTRRLWREDGRGLRAFLGRARREIDGLAVRHPTRAAETLGILDHFDDVSTGMMALQADPETALYQANDYMIAAWGAVSAWMALRLELVGPERPGGSGWRFAPTDGLTGICGTRKRIRP
ncbi:MAG: hypothetical protein K0M47_25600, partial [Rhizobium sp.]|nr:hypothetical protein [Rhizobium sp.]